MNYELGEEEIYRRSNLSDFKIIDTEFDSQFDDLVVMASQHFGMPISLVSLVDADRQWFKAMVGLSVRETPRRHSFCSHAILRPGEVMVVEDARADPRFQENPMVNSEPHIRFYAGAPIVTYNGTSLGTVCVIDHEPRTFSPGDKEMLARFARTARSLFELHRRNELLREAAMRDPLTGLLNRLGLEKALRQTLEGALNGEGCGLLYLDLDHFKQINDDHGHAIGDSLLEEMARRLRAAVRQGDLVARFGGDEFVILLIHPVDATVLELIVQQVRLASSAAVTLNGHTIAPTITIGSALAPRDAITRGELLRAADKALYAAKRAGRGQLAIAGMDKTYATEFSTNRLRKKASIERVDMIRCFRCDSKGSTDARR